MKAHERLQRPMAFGAKRLFAVSAIGAFLATSIGCAHTGEVVPEKTAQENEVLRERVRHLERRVSDLDTQLTLLTDKVSSDPAPVLPAQRQIDRTRATDLAPTSIPAEITHEGDRVEKIGIGMDSIDLAPRPRPRASGRMTQAELWSAPAEGTATLSDADAIAMLEAERASAMPSGAMAAAPQGPPSNGAKPIYAWAMKRLDAGDILPAIAAFEDVMERYPEHHLADNALYWTAVAHARGGNQRLAISVFQSLPMRFPRSPKLADALFEMAVAYEALGETKLAQSFYGQMLSQYPSAERRGDAERAIKRLR